MLHSRDMPTHTVKFEYIPNVAPFLGNRSCERTPSKCSLDCRVSGVVAMSEVRAI